jgi:hypothetical protein
MRKHLRQFALLMGTMLISLAPAGYPEQSAHNTTPQEPTASACANSPHQSFVGTYRGLIGYQAEARQDPVMNELFLDQDCSLSGWYRFDEKTGPVSGTFYPIQVIDGKTLKGFWNDSYGKGSWQVTFSNDFRSFEGTWGSEESDDIQGTWSGKR